MPEMVMLDSMVCIWAFKGQASKGQEGKIPQANALLASLEEQGVEIGVSAVSLSELMVRMRDEDRYEFVQRFQKGFCIYPFDTSAAIESARLFRTWIDGTKNKTSVRNVVKADLQIAGTAIAKGASILYSEDEELRRIAGRDIEVKPLPPIEQPEFDL
jgi:predicted nucleic acid-binding protein